MMAGGAPPCGLCPHCGHNLDREQRVPIGPLDYDPAGDARWNGAAVNLTMGEHLILGSLVHAGGRIISRDLIAERVGSESLSKAVEILICRLRRKLRGAGAPANMIENVINRGYRLNLPLLETFSAPRYEFGAVQ